MQEHLRLTVVGAVGITGLILRRGGWAGGNGGRAGSRVPQLVAGLIIGEAILHRLFGRKTLRVSLAEVVAALGTGFAVIFPSLMKGIDQSIVSERQKTFGELIDRVALCRSEHFKILSGRHPNRCSGWCWNGWGLLDTVRAKKRFAQFTPSSTEICNPSVAAEAVIPRVYWRVAGLPDRRRPTSLPPLDDP
jgi:hypothetical protein